MWIAKITERGSLPSSFVPPKTSAGSGPIPATGAP